MNPSRLPQVGLHPLVYIVGWLIFPGHLADNTPLWCLGGQVSAAPLLKRCNMGNFLWDFHQDFNGDLMIKSHEISWHISIKSPYIYTYIWVCLKMSCSPLYPMVLLILIPMKNGYFIGNINPTFSDKPTCWRFTPKCDTLWWTNSLQWKDPPLLMGKSTISTGPFSIAMLVHQRVPQRLDGLNIFVLNGRSSGSNRWRDVNVQKYVWSYELWGYSLKLKSRV